MAWALVLVEVAIHLKEAAVAVMEDLSNSISNLFHTPHSLVSGRHRQPKAEAVRTYHFNNNKIDRLAQEDIQTLPIKLHAVQCHRTPNQHILSKGLFPCRILR
jgi:hypothetical protein